MNYTNIANIKKVIKLCPIVKEVYITNNKQNTIAYITLKHSANNNDVIANITKLCNNNLNKKDIPQKFKIVGSITYNKNKKVNFNNSKQSNNSTTSKNIKKSCNTPNPTNNNNNQKSDDKVLQAEIELWKEVNSQINKIEESYGVFYSLLITFCGLVLTKFDGVLIPKKIMDGCFVILCFSPMIIAAVVTYLSQNLRWVAILRMYAKSLETDINNRLGKKTFHWNGRIVNDYVAKNNIISTILIPITNIMFFLFICIFFDYSMLCFDGINNKIKFLYIIYTIFLLLICALPFSQNEKIRKSNFKLDK